MDSVCIVQDYFERLNLSTLLLLLDHIPLLFLPEVPHELGHSLSVCHLLLLLLALYGQFNASLCSHWRCFSCTTVLWLRSSLTD